MVKKILQERSEGGNCTLKSCVIKEEVILSSHLNEI
jgi:hypothetical protein